MIKIFRIEYEPFNKPYSFCPSLGPIDGYFVDCSSDGRYFGSYLHLVDFHCHQLDSVHHLVGRSFLHIEKYNQHIVTQTERIFMRKKFVSLIQIRQMVPTKWRFNVPDFISKIRSFESTKLLTLSDSCKASDCNRLGSLRCMTTVCVGSSRDACNERTSVKNHY